MIPVNLSDVKGVLTRTADALKGAFFPTKCLMCESFFHLREKGGSRLTVKGFPDGPILDMKGKEIFERLMVPFLCLSCRCDFIPVESPVCSCCGVMFKSREGEDHTCAECLRAPKKFRMARAAGVYDGALMATIHLFKYKGKMQLVRPLGMLLFTAFTDLWGERDIDVVIPVPLHVKRLRTRGFNQAVLLVRDWADFGPALKVTLPNAHLDRQLLVRDRWTEPQTGMDRKKRALNIRGAFKVNAPSNITGKRILLVDDVYTTGATANECARTLLDCGAGQVDVLTLARAM
ncbi:MAG: ComF family protein [Deltaproteobacteria bacterium]|nr:ComF family protein [Deltaproteobacteria bacterium]MBW2192627.1 ComF family protein [Deltaproteobacteria bacterium]